MLPVFAEAAAQHVQASAPQVAGRITASPADTPLADALVTIEGTTLRALSDSSGRYRLLGVPAGPQVLRVQRIGYAPRRVDLIVPTTGMLELDVTMARNALLLEGVRVVADPAGRARGEAGTASVIGSEAIRSQVASSLAGVLELVPGTVLQPPGLDNIQQFSLRASPISGGTDISNDANAQSLSAFGTLLVLDGVPLSNNANLQSLGSRAEIFIANTAGAGIDLRRMPATTIERVEVLRGIPSARWGDLTHGAVIVDTRAGEVQPEFLARVDATTTELSLLGGRRFGARQTGTLTSNVARTRIGAGVRDDAATRFSTQLAHRWTSSDGTQAARNTMSPPRLTLDTRFDAYRLTDDRPEVATVEGSSSYASDFGLRLLERLTLVRDNDDRLQVTAALSYGEQRNWARRNLSPGVRPATTRLVPGTQEGTYVGGLYNARVDVDGAPVFAYARGEYTARRRAFGGEHELRGGLELRHEANRGAGTQFDLLAPPQATQPGVRGFDRPRRFADIPAFALTGLYLDDRFTHTRPSGAWVAVQGGLRVDALHEPSRWASAPRSVVLQPRLNTEFAPWRWLSLRAGAGRMAKAPSVNSLFPQPDFYDVVNVNYFANDPAERLTVLTTYVFDPSNPSLGHATLDRAEASVDVRVGGAFVSITGYTDELRGGFGAQPTPSYVLRDIYTLTNANPGSGQPPDYVTDPPERTDTLPVLVSRAANNVTQRSSGIELTADLPEIRRIRTRVALQGAFSTSELYQDRIELPSSFPAFQRETTLARIPFYGSFLRTGSLGLLTTRITHHQPDAGLIITVVVQHTLHQERQNVGDTDSTAFRGYLTRDGTLVPVPAADRDDPQYADLRIPRPLGTQVLRSEPDWLLSLQVAKSLPLGGRFSFYAFNALDRTGQFPSGSIVPNVFPPTRFGVELTMPFGPLLPGGR